LNKNISQSQHLCVSTRCFVHSHNLLNGLFVQKLLMFQVIRRRYRSWLRKLYKYTLFFLFICYRNTLVYAVYGLQLFLLQNAW